MSRQAKRLYATNCARWRVIRAQVLAREPLCRMCKAQGKITAASHVDHINGDTADNRWANLRPATRSENMQNRRVANSNSKTGLLGAKPSRNAFRAQIKISGRCVNLGTFSSPEAAHAAYLTAKAELHPFSTL